MKKLNIFTILFILLFLSFSFLIYRYVQIGKRNLELVNKIEKMKPQPVVTINDIKIPVEIADTQPKWENGLSNRSSLDANSGMLFVFAKKDIKTPFWMKDMRFSIDIIWINDDKIIQIDKGLPFPEPGTSDTQLKTYIPSTLIDYVLEVNAGFSDKKGIKVGDTIKLPDGL